ncbi:MAG: amidohydrolase family protein [Ruminococcaceae bacterium]|nr:amidohydrolase family protein [Oscillospiraceae bacterium]
MKPPIIIDVNCLCGHWPFRKVPRHSFADLCQIHQENGISGGFVASLDSIFYADPMEGDMDLQEQIKDSHYCLIQTVNPMHPALAADLNLGQTHLKSAGVRIYPVYHGYSLLEPQVAHMMTLLAQHKLPLFLPLRMEDERMDHLITPIPADLEQLQRFITAHPQQTIMLLNVRMGEIFKLKDVLKASPHVFVDISGFKEYQFSVEKAVAAVGADHIVYGSLYPLYSFKSTLLSLDKADLTTDDRIAVASGNAMTALGLMSGNA